MGINALFSQWLFYLPFSLAYHSYFTIKTKILTGKYWSAASSRFINREGKFDYILILALLARSLITLVGFLTLGLISQYSLKANLSPAVVTTLSSVNPFLTALVFFFIYKERLMRKHFVGMIILLLCVVCIASSKYLSFISKSPNEN